MADKYINLKTIMESPMRRFVRFHTGETEPEDWVISGADIMKSSCHDVVEVVRCKDCIYKDTCEYFCSHDENWFCGDGKRKQDL